MVRGLDRFREHFAGFSDRYVLIGGTAATVTMKEAGDVAYPHMIELFSWRLDDLSLGGDAQLTPLPMDGTVSSLSAILLDDDYYAFVMEGRRQTDELAWIEADRLIPLKASAWLDLSAREAAGEQVDGRDIRKHLNDVFRLAQLLSGDLRIVKRVALQ